MILVDYIGHIVSDKDEEELHKFALEKLSMKKSWFQASGALLKHPHYDLTSTRMRDKATEEGAELVTPQDLLRRAYWRK